MKKLKTPEGYFNKDFSVYGIKAIRKLFPDIPQTSLVKNNLGISYHTYLKIRKNGTTKGLRVSTVKKISKAINNTFTANNQILIALTAKHIKRYKNISNKKINDYRKDVKRMRKQISGLKNKEYILFRFIYGRG